MTMNEAKTLLENKKNVKVTYGVPFQDSYVFGIAAKLLIGGLYMVNKETGEIGIFSPIYHDVKEYQRNFDAGVVYYSKEPFDMPTPIQNS